MKLTKRLQQPAALVFQGFMVGAVLYFTYNPFAGSDAPPQPPAQGSILSTLHG